MKLKPHERLAIERRRRDESQTEAAKRYGVTLYEYRQWELGNGKLPARAGASVRRIEPFEECFIQRTRMQGLSAGMLAKDVGCSRWWLTQMERGQQQPEALVAFWRGMRARVRARAARTRRRTR